MQPNSQFVSQPGNPACPSKVIKGQYYMEVKRKKKTIYEKSFEKISYSLLIHISILL